VVTISDVAQAAGVSIATVSRVLSPGAVPHPVRADTADRVRDAARRLNFIPSPLARGLATRRSGLIGLIVPDLADPHYPQIAVGAEDAAREANMAALICNTLGESERLAEYLQLMQARRVDAIVLSGATSMNAVELQTLQRCDVPMVLIGRPATQGQWPYVSIDNRLGGQLATRHLIDVGKQRIVHLSGPRSQTTMSDRARGYLEQMVRRDADIVESNGTPEDGYDLLLARFKVKPLPDAVFAATDRLAVAALAVAADRSLHVPGDVAIVGFDDIPLASQLRPTLSSVAQPAYELGSVAVEMAQLLAAGEDVHPRVLPPRLIPRQSTLGPGGRFSR
jgi:DNA-binding LacI/PurR family transcriptional regulator